MAVADDFKPFYIYLQKFIDLDEASFERWILPYLKLRKFEKREVLTKVGETEQYLNFIIRGIARKFLPKGREQIVTQISHEGHLIHSQESFHSQQPSEYGIDAVEELTVISITYNDLEKIYTMDAKMEKLGRKIAISTMVIKDKWQTQLTTKTPRERFLDFVAHSADLYNRVPQKTLASFLSIKPETFSRFKHLLRGDRS